MRANVGRSGAVLRRSVLVALAGVAGWASVASAQVQQVVPGDALVVIHVNNLGRVSEKLANFSKQLGLAEMSPAMADPLATIQQQMGVSQGVDKAGDMAFAFVDPATYGSDPEQSMLAIVPVTDYTAFVRQLPESQTTGAVTTFTNPQGEQMFAVNWGKFAAVSPSKEVLAKQGTGLKLAGLAAKEWGEKDTTLYANLEALRGKLLPELQKNREKILAEVERNLTQAPAAVEEGEEQTPEDKAAAAKQLEAKKRAAPLVRAGVNQALNVGEAFLRDATAATYSVNLTDAGINSTLLAEFTPGSYLGKAVGEVKNSNAPLLVGIPAAKYMFFGGANLASPVYKRITDDLLAPITKELGGLGEHEKQVRDLIGAARRMMDATESQSFAMLAPTGQVGAEGLLQTIAVSRGDAAVMKQAQTDAFNSQQALMQVVNPQEQAAVKTTYTANAKTVNGVQFDLMQTQFNINPTTPQEAQAAQFMSVLYGPGGLNAYTAVVDPKTMIAVAGASDQVISEVLKTARAGEAPLSTAAATKQADAQLPAQRVAALYVPVDNIVRTGLSYAAQFGFAMPVQIPENLPPVGVTAGTEGSAIRLDSHVPTPLVQSLVSAGLQVYMGMMQGGGGGGGMGGGGGAQDGGGL